MSYTDTSAAALLGRIPLFAGLREGDRLEIAARMEASQFEREDIIFYQGDPADRLWLVRDGRVKIVHQDADGREVILELVSPGEPFGGAVLFMPQQPATAKAMTEVEALSLPASAYSQALINYPELGLKLVRMLGLRLHSMMQLQILAGVRVERRLAHILLKLAERAGRPEAGGTLVPIPLARQDLADMAGTTLETAIRTMSRFRQHGLIETRRGGYLLIIDMEQLRKQAGDQP